MAFINRSFDRILNNNGCLQELLGRRTLFAPNGLAMWQRRFLTEVAVTDAQTTTRTLTHL